MSKTQEGLGPERHDAPANLSGSARERTLGIVERCGGGRERHGKWLLPCPAHDDDDPSLSITYDGDKTLLHCFGSFR